MMHVSNYTVSIRQLAFARLLVTLVEDGQRLTLRKATAMNILMDRGYKLTLDDMKPVDE